MTDQPNLPDTPNTSASAEVSLRDVYLVLLRGLPLILGLALLAGLGAYVLNARRQPVYSAESIVMVTPPPIEIQSDDALAFSPSNEITFQSYNTLARSQDVLQATVSQLPGSRLAPNGLLSLGTLREVVSPSAANAETLPPLSVVHRVRNADPERAALLADAWAQSTLAAVRRSLFASLELVNTTTGQEVARLQKTVEEVEVRVQAFAAGDKGTLLETELEGLTRQLTEGRTRQGSLDAEIAATRARIAALGAQLGAAGAPVSTSKTLTPEFLGVLNAQQALDAAEGGFQTRPGFTSEASFGRVFRETLTESATLAELLEGNEDAFTELAKALYGETLSTLRSSLAEERRAVQAEARAQAAEALELALLGYASTNIAAQVPPSEGNADTLTLLGEAQLQREQIALEGLLAERAQLAADLPGYTRRATSLQRQIATLDQRRDTLERELESVLNSYNAVAELQSSVSYLTELAPTNARILSQASVPTAPTGSSRTFNTVLAAVFGGLAGLVFVFLRAAVRRPETRFRKATL